MIYIFKDMMYSRVMCVQQIDQRKLTKGDIKAQYIQRGKKKIGVILTTLIIGVILTTLKLHHSKAVKNIFHIQFLITN